MNSPCRHGDVAYRAYSPAQPAKSKVGRLVGKLKAKGHGKVSAIKIAQKATGMSYRTGHKSKKGKR